MQIYFYHIEERIAREFLTTTLEANKLPLDKAGDYIRTVPAESLTEANAILSKRKSPARAPKLPHRASQIKPKTNSAPTKRTKRIGIKK